MVRRPGRLHAGKREAKGRLALGRVWSECCSPAHNPPPAESGTDDPNPVARRAGPTPRDRPSFSSLRSARRVRIPVRMHVFDAPSAPSLASGAMALTALSGRTLGTQKVVIERGPVRVFAQALMDDDAVYSADDAPVPPTFPFSMTYWGSMG